MAFTSTFEKSCCALAVYEQRQRARPVRTKNFFTFDLLQIKGLGTLEILRAYSGISVFTALRQKVISIQDGLILFARLINL